METIQSIYKWLDSSGDTIRHLLEYYLDHGKKMMLWGAGNRGTAFLQRFDSHAEYLSRLYDMYPAKQGVTLGTGYRVYDPGERECDVIFVLSNGVERFARQYISKHHRKEKIIDVTDIIFGNLSMKDIINDEVNEEDIDFRSVRAEKTCGLVIMYNPKIENFSYARQFAEDLDHLVLFDNSREDSQTLFEQLDFPENTEYQWNNGGNIGLGEPINRLASGV